MNENQLQEYTRQEFLDLQWQDIPVSEREDYILLGRIIKQEAYGLNVYWLLKDDEVREHLLSLITHLAMEAIGAEHRASTLWAYVEELEKHFQNIVKKMINRADVPKVLQVIKEDEEAIGGTVSDEYRKEVAKRIILNGLL